MKTHITKLFNIKHPIIQGIMADAPKSLAASLSLEADSRMNMETCFIAAKEDHAHEKG
ncbi:MAG: hypothetical protein U9N77_01230 [Thermodesulfobacteriota bacterium]|nr:hypothetical protein [Thermodesulfobacteriota bacterium]